MTDKEIIINGVDVSECYGYVHNAKEYDCGETYSKFHYRYCEENPNCYYKQLKRKENELEELRQYHNKCCEEFKKEKQDLIDKYNQLSINFYNGDYCNTEHCSLLKSKEQECEELKEKVKELRQGWINCDEERNLQEANSEFRQRVINRYKQTLTEIKKILEILESR